MQEQEANIRELGEKAFRALVRRRWWFLLPATIVTFGSLLLLSRIPNRYTSQATLLVVQQQVPQRYVLPTTTTDIREALQATTQEVLSRAHLTEIIEQFDLYSRQRSRLSPESVLNLMRRDIEIQAIESPTEGRDVNSFRISFIASSPQLAQEVTSKLTSLFIEQNLETREHQAATTTDFLREQLEATKTRLAEAEDQVRSFKMEHLGELPEQQPGNLAILSSLQSQLQSTTASLSRASEQRQYLESLSDYRTGVIANDLKRLKEQRDKLLDLYTPQYPAVAKLTQKITQTEAALKSLQVWRASALDAPRTENPVIPLDDDTSLGQLRGQLEANRLEIQNLTKDEKRLKDSIAQYQRRLNATPVREQQLAGVLRNYDQLKQDYADLLAKESQSRMAGDLEKRQEGQQFRMVDRPSLPTVPSSPNRLKVSLGGAGAGIAIGLILAILMDLRDTSFHSEDDLSKHFSLPLVVGIPTLLTPYEQQTRARKKRLEWLAGSGLVLAVVLAQLYELYLYRSS